jgi:molecular chaperone HtpG
MKVEGMMEYTALMYLPERAPMDLYTREARRGLSLYTKNVFIMEDCRDLMPEYLRFIRGLVDSPDIPLNVSRETVQQDRVIASMRKTLTKKWLSRFEELANDEREAWEKIWIEFGSAIKEGFHYDPPNKDRLAKIALWKSTHGDGWTTLAEYVERMPTGQDDIYVLIGKTLESLQDSPQLEMFKSKGVEVILLTDAVDEIIVRALDTFEEKKVVDAARGEVDLDEVIAEGEDGKDEEKEESSHDDMLPLCERLQTVLDGPIEEVRPSKRLTDSAVCLVTPENGITLQMEQMMRSMGQEVPQSKRHLELNPNHALIQKLSKLHAKDADDDRLTAFGEILYAQALLSEGGQLENPARYARQIADVLAKAL